MNKSELNSLLTEKQITAKEKARARSQESYQMNKDSIKKRSKERYDNNRLAILEQQKIYNKEHAEQYKAYAKEYYLKNKEKYRKNQTNNTPPKLPKVEQPVEYTCEYCNKTLKFANKKIHEISNIHLRNKLKKDIIPLE